MPRTVLITEGDSPLGGALTRLLAARGFSVVATRDRAGSDATMPAGSLAHVHAVAWNRRSPVSARSLILDAVSLSGAHENAGGLDEAIILEPPWPAGARLEEASSADIERSFDEAKGPLFVAREVLALFARRGAGVLAFVMGAPGPGPLEAGLQAGLHGTAAGILAAPRDASVLVNGFQTSSPEIEEYAQFIDKTLEERARRIGGRWFTCPARGGFFRRAPSAGLSPGRRANTSSWCAQKTSSASAICCRRRASHPCSAAGSTSGLCASDSSMNVRMHDRKNASSAGYLPSRGKTTQSDEPASAMR